MKSYWIWHYGDYEIFHITKTNLRRENRGKLRSAFWKLSAPYVNVRFRKNFSCDSGYFICYTNGDGYITVDGNVYPTNVKIDLCKGFHKVEIQVFKYDGLPSAFVESDVCPSDGSWACDHFAGELSPVGFSEHLNSPDQNPEIFPFQYERKLPISTKDDNNGILYDFGTEIFGFLNIDNADKNSVLNISYGESEEEALDCEFSEITDCVNGKTKYRLKQRAFRYVYISPASEELSISADYEYLPLIQNGNFNCNLKLINDIYSTSAYTFHLNCREFFLDGIKRDRWVWSGDAYQCVRINRYLFADKDIEQRTIIGLIGKEPIEQHINTILDYSLLWIITLYEHYMTYGDTEFIERIFPMALKLLQFCETRLNKEGFIQGFDCDWTFIDWSDIEKTGAISAEQMLLIASYSAMAKLSGILGKDSDVFAKKAVDLTNKVNEYFWDEKSGAFIDSYATGNNHVTRHANIFAIMYDIATPEQTEKIVKNVIMNQAVTPITTPYFKAYELDVLAKIGEISSVEKQISSYWGDMIKLGAKTIWEEYDPSKTGAQHYAMYGGRYSKSLCHAWGAGPIYLFGRYYIGVYPTSAGYETFNVEPTLGGFEEFCGTAPINGHTVTVKLNKHTLSVITTKAGGTLIWQGEKYTLIPDQELFIKYL